MSVRNQILDEFTAALALARLNGISQDQLVDMLFPIAGSEPFMAIRWQMYNGLKEWFLAFFSQEQFDKKLLPRIPLFAAKVECVLYVSAINMEAYTDLSTLKQRIRTMRDSCNMDL